MESLNIKTNQKAGQMRGSLELGRIVDESYDDDHSAADTDSHYEIVECDLRRSFRVSSHSKSSRHTKEEHNYCILDIGSYSIKAGILSSDDPGTDGPSLLLPNVIGFPKYNGRVTTDLWTKRQDIYEEDANSSRQTKSVSQSLTQMEANTRYSLEAYKMSKLLSLRYPLEFITEIDWDDLSEVIEHVLTDSLGYDDLITDSFVLADSAAFQGKKNKESVYEMLFDELGIPRVCFLNQGLCSLAAEGKTTGLVIDCGDATCNVIPVFDGRVEVHAQRTLSAGGRTLDYFLMEILRDKYSFNTSFDREIARFMKETLCSVAENNNIDFQYIEPKEYHMPNNQTISVTSEQHLCPEVLFNTTLIDRDGESLQHLVANCLTNVDQTLVKPLSQNTLLAGGTSCFKNFELRLKNEVTKIKKILGNELKFCGEFEKRQQSAWIGASILSSQNAISQSMITKDAYEELGIDRILSL